MVQRGITQTFTKKKVMVFLLIKNCKLSRCLIITAFICTFSTVIILLPPSRDQQWFIGSPRKWTRRFLITRKRIINEVIIWSYSVTNHDQSWRSKHPYCSCVAHTAYTFPFNIGLRCVIVIQERLIAMYRMLFWTGWCWTGIWKQLEEEERSLSE